MNQHAKRRPNVGNEANTVENDFRLPKIRNGEEGQGLGRHEDEFQSLTLCVYIRRRCPNLGKESSTMENDFNTIESN